MATTKYAISRMSFVEFAEWREKDPVIIIPIASHEQHGPQSPMGDYLIAEKVAELAAERSAAAVVAPAVPFGYSDTFRCFAGSVQLRPETMSMVLEDIIDSFLYHDINRLLFFNGHHGNSELLHHVTHKVRRKHGVIVPTLNFWGSIPKSLYQEYEGRRADLGHGGDPMTSVYMHLFPDDTRPDLVSPINMKEPWGLDIANLASLQFAGASLNVPLEQNDVNELGMSGGDGRNANPEFGAAVVEHLVDYTAQLIGLLKTRNIRSFE